jgi:hypothetical protein
MNLRDVYARRWQLNMQINGQMMTEKRTLTDADIDAITEKLEERVIERFQINVGKGILNAVWKWFIVALIAVAAYGAAGGFKKWGA